MSQTVRSSHFTVENLEFDGVVHKDASRNLERVYQGFAAINKCYTTFILSNQSGLSVFYHDHREHSSECLWCSGVDTPIYELADTYHNELFQLIIHHPAVRLHWALINPSDYEVEV